MLANAQPKPPSRAAEKAHAKALKAAYQRVIYRLVSKRDGYRCRCCGRDKNLHHHHMTRRSRGGADSEQNVLLLCSICHADIHAWRLHIIGNSANGILRFTR